MLSTAPAPSRDGTEGRVYGGDPNLIHVPDGLRRFIGDRVAAQVDRLMRSYAQNRTFGERFGQKLCPGCYMVVIFNAAVALAKANGQPLTELGRSLGDAFHALAEAQRGAEGIEEIIVALDEED